MKTKTKTKTKTKKLNRKTICLLIYVLTIVAGTAGGYLLYRLVGCSTGSCSLTANPYLCIAFGAIFGFLIGIILCPQKKTEDGRSARRAEKQNNCHGRL